MLEFLGSELTSLPPLARFAVGLALIVVIPRLSKRVGLPGEVGLLLSGVVFGPHVLGVVGEHRPIAEFLGELGKLLLMFFVGLEMDLALLREKRARSIVFGLLTTGIPLLLGTLVGFWHGSGLVPAIVLGSLLASHTLLGAPIVDRLGASRLEPVTITAGATVLSDTLSLVVFAVCVSTYESGFSVSRLALQLVEIAVFLPLVLFGLSHLGERALKKVEDEEEAYFILILGMLATTAVLAEAINLPGIIGTFLAGLAVNAAVREKPAKDKLEFFGHSLFIPIFFIVTGFLIDPLVFARSLIENFSVVAGIIVALLMGKWIAAEIAGRAFRYTPAARRTMWSLTLPQVAATLAATVVAFNTRNPAGERLLDGQMVNAVLVLMLTTSILGPVLTERYAPLMLKRNGQGA